MPRTNQTSKKATGTNAAATVNLPTKGLDRRWRIVQILASFKAPAQGALTVTLHPEPTVNTPAPADVIVVDIDINNYADPDFGSNGLQMPGPGSVDITLA